MLRSLIRGVFVKVRKEPLRHTHPWKAAPSLFAAGTSTPLDRLDFKLNRLPGCTLPSVLDARQPIVPRVVRACRR